MHDCASTRRFTHDSDAMGIAAEKVNVFLHPLQCKTLVEQTSIGHGIVSVRYSSEPALDESLGACIDWCVRNETYEESQAIINRHVNDAFISVSSTQCDEILAIAELLLPSECKATPVDPDEHGSCGAISSSLIDGARDQYIEEQTIFGCARVYGWYILHGIVPIVCNRPASGERLRCGYPARQRLRTYGCHLAILSSPVD